MKQDKNITIGPNSHSDIQSRGVPSPLRDIVQEQAGYPCKKFESSGHLHPDMARTGPAHRRYLSCRILTYDHISKLDAQIRGRAPYTNSNLDYRI